MGNQSNQPLRRKVAFIHKKPIIVESVPDLRALASIVGADILPTGFKNNPSKSLVDNTTAITPYAPGRMLWLAAIFSSASSAKMTGNFKANLVVDGVVVQGMLLELGHSALPVIIVGTGSTGRTGFKDMPPIYQAGYQPIDYDTVMSLSIISDFPISVSFVATMETHSYVEE